MTEPTAHRALEMCRVIERQAFADIEECVAEFWTASDARREQCRHNVRAAIREWRCAEARRNAAWVVYVRAALAVPAIAAE